MSLESTAFVAFLVFKLCVVEIIVEEEGGVRRERGLESRLLIKWSKQEKWSCWVEQAEIDCGDGGRRLVTE